MTDARDLLAELMSLSATWQSWTGSADAAAAKARVHQVSAAPEFTRPLAFLPSSAETDFGRGGYSASRWEMWIEDNAAAGTADKTILDAFETKVAAVIREMIQASEGGGRILVRSIRVREPAARARRESEAYVNIGLEVFTGLILDF